MLDKNFEPDQRFHQTSLVKLTCKDENEQRQNRRNYPKDSGDYLWNQKCFSASRDSMCTCTN